MSLKATAAILLLTLSFALQARVKTYEVPLKGLIGRHQNTTYIFADTFFNIPHRNKRLQRIELHKARNSAKKIFHLEGNKIIANVISADDGDEIRVLMGEVDLNTYRVDLNTYGRAFYKTKNKLKLRVLQNRQLLWIVRFTWGIGCGIMGCSTDPHLKDRKRQLVEIETPYGEVLCYKRDERKKGETTLTYGICKKR